MKKKIIVIFTLIICALLISSCSCNKRKDEGHKYVGAYLEIIEVEKKSIDDRNLKIYYDEEKGLLVDRNQIYEYQIKASSLTKKIEKNVYDISAAYSLSTPSDSKLKEIKVYPIIFDGKNYKVLDESKTIKLVDNETKGVSFNINYSYDKEEYTFKISIKIYKKETY